MAGDKDIQVGVSDLDEPTGAGHDMMPTDDNAKMRRWAASEAVRFGAGLAAPVVKPVTSAIKGATDKFEEAQTESDERIEGVKEDLDFFSMFKE
jgi:hypothetical protein